MIVPSTTRGDGARSPSTPYVGRRRERSAHTFRVAAHRRRGCWFRNGTWRGGHDEQQRRLLGRCRKQPGGGLRTTLGHVRELDGDRGRRRRSNRRAGGVDEGLLRVARDWASPDALDVTISGPVVTLSAGRRDSNVRPARRPARGPRHWGRARPRRWDNRSCPAAYARDGSGDCETRAVEGHCRTLAQAMNLDSRPSVTTDYRSSSGRAAAAETPLRPSSPRRVRRQSSPARE